MENIEVKQEATAEVKTPKLKVSKKKRKWPKRVIIIAVLAVAVIFLLRSCTATPTLSAGAYLPSTAAVQNMTVSVSGTGTIEPTGSYKVTTLIKGEVLEAPFEEGQMVHKGDLLFRMDSKDLENNIKQLTLSLQGSQLTYDDLLRQQRDSQKDRSITANASGIVTKRYVDPGDKVAAGTPIADILDRENMKITLPFHAAQAAAISVGQSATVSVDGTLNTLVGTVDSVAATDSVGPGGTLVRELTIKVANPGTLSDTSTGTATVGAVACSANGTFAYGAQKQLVAKISGEIETLSVAESGRVSENQVVGTFKDVDMNTQVKSAKLSLENAQLSLQNARDKLIDYSITSTIDGTVIEKNVNRGDNIDGTTSGSAISYPAVIYDLSALTFDMKINELDINKIKVGQAVEISAAALDGKSFTGHVDKVNINGTTTNGITTYPVTVVVDDPKELLPGMNVSSKIIVEEVGSVLCIPVEAVGRGNVVLIATPGALDASGNVIDASKLEPRPITLGRNDSTVIEVLDGLAEGDVVFTENAASNMMAAMMGG